MNAIVNRLIQAQAHAEADPRHTSLRIWRDGVEVEMWASGRRVTRRIRWIEIERNQTNVVISAIDACASELATGGQ